MAIFSATMKIEEVIATINAQFVILVDRRDVIPQGDGVGENRLAPSHG